MRLSNKIGKIAVFRALQLGDLLCSVPAFRALRHAFPNAHISLIGLPWAKSFAQRFKHYFNQFTHFPGFPGLPEQPYSFDTTVRFFRTMHRHSFDLLLQMHGNGNIINPLLPLCNVRQYAGYFRQDNFCPDPDTFMPYPADTNPEILRHLALMEFLGIPPQGTHLEFPLIRADYRDLNRLRLPIHRRRYAIIHPGARDNGRLWDPAHFARLGDIAHDHSLDVLVTGVESERDITADVIRRMKRPPIDLTGRTSLGALGALVKDARLVIANDTGISHIADALRTPSVIISLAHDPERWTPLDSHRHTFITCRGRECFEEAAKRVETHLSPGQPLPEPSHP